MCNTVKLKAEEFICRSMNGESFEYDGTIFFYDCTKPQPFRVRPVNGTSDGMMLLSWAHLNGCNEFTVVKSRPSTTKNTCTDSCISMDDYVTVKNWIGSNNRSYIGDIFKVLYAENGVVLAKPVFKKYGLKDKEKIVFCLTDVNLQVLSNDFVRKAIC